MANNWTEGNHAQEIIDPTRKNDPGAYSDLDEYYGGRLIAESVDPEAMPLLLTAPDLLGACELGDFLGNPGPFLLNYAADLLNKFAPITAEELRRKAESEQKAILKARGESEDPHA